MILKKKYIQKLNNEEKAVLLDGATEAPFSGQYDDFYLDGVYICKLCGFHLFNSKSKFKSGCGWPSFDDAVSGAIIRKRDVGLGRIRTEVICGQCEGHLGHVFEGENYTDKNTRYCVNSLSLKFISK